MYQVSSLLVYLRLQCKCIKATVNPRSMLYKLHFLRKPNLTNVPIECMLDEDEEIVHVEFMLIRLLLMLFATCSLGFALASLYAITNILSYTYLLGSIIICIVSSLFLVRQSLYLDLVERHLPSCFIALLCQILALFVLFFVQLNDKVVIARHQ